MLSSSTPVIGIVGLGYVGLPLAVAFARQYDTLGYDLNPRRIAQLRAGYDHTKQTPAEALAQVPRLSFSSDPEALRRCNTYIVTVPTPIDEAQRPDLSPIRRASEALAGLLKRGDLVVYESTVYPGTTEEVCVPILEHGSGLRLNDGFHCGYSPERINPGDPQRGVTGIRKVTSGSTPEAAARVDALYRSIIHAGTYKAPSIRVAEAAKVIENVQRDVNIALVNELAMIFHRLGIDTHEVLAAAASKWNFLPFQPGLVGGHCIGVDPYYLTYRAEISGYHPELILAARRVNSEMGRYVADRVIRLLARRHRPVAGARALVLGLAFKENCPDIRNNRVVDLVHELQDAQLAVEVYDPWVDAVEAESRCGVRPVGKPDEAGYDAIVLAVAHREFIAMDAAAVRALGKPGAVVYDVKRVWPAEAVDGRL